MAWMATDDNAADQAFNVANGDLIRWCRFWPKLAEAFQMPLGSVRPVCLADVMADKEPVWQRITERYGLENGRSLRSRIGPMPTARSSEPGMRSSAPPKREASAFTISLTARRISWRFWSVIASIKLLP